jgi:hypothetical protein
MKKAHISRLLTILACFGLCFKAFDVFGAKFEEVSSLTPLAVPLTPTAQTSTSRGEEQSDPGWLAIATVCVDEGSRRSPDGQKNTARDYMHHTMANHAAYAAAHGYPYFPLTSSRSELSDKDVRYHKLGWVRQLLRNYTWVFYTDCDSLFLDFCVDVGFWPRQAQRRSHDSQHTADLIFTGDKGWAMNSGQFIFRNTVWSHQLLSQALLEPRNTHGCVGNDNAAFNWLLWRDCTITHGDFTTWWDDISKCEEMRQLSSFADKLGCAPLSVYANQVEEARKRGPLFRLHLAGPQRQKKSMVDAHLQVVKKYGECLCNHAWCTSRENGRNITFE